MRIHYSKMHGTGNLILVVDQRGGDAPVPGAETVRFLANERTGPGFDQLMWVTSSRNPDALAAYRVFNADGSEVEQCGNGVRCVARLLAGDDTADLTLDSPAGLIDARLETDGNVAVNMGRPAFEPAAIPFAAETRADSYLIEVDGSDHEVSVLSMGNPHCVIRVASVAAAPVATLGPLLETHERFPRRANVGFMQICDNQRINLRVYERGVGETAACGTGACAAVVAGQRLGLLSSDVTVALPGGEVMVSWRGGDAPVWLSGNAEFLHEGTIEV